MYFYSMKPNLPNVFSKFQDQATDTRNDYKQEENYIGLTGITFKTRYRI